MFPSLPGVFSFACVTYIHNTFTTNDTYIFLKHVKFKTHTHTHITHVVLGGKWVVGRIHMRCEWAGKCNGKFVRAHVCVFVCACDLGAVVVVVVVVFGMKVECFG